jgi:flagellar assembly protein FliH
MSKVTNRNVFEQCKPWRAPDLTIAGSIINSEQQKKLVQQSYEESSAKGYMEGVAQGQKEVTEQLGSLQSLMSTLAMPLPDLDNKVVDELVQLCMAVVKQMVRRELKISPGEVVAVVREALSLLPATAAEVILELHPDDARLIRNALTQTEGEASWKILEDPLLTRGGCRVLSSTSRIDATVESRMNAVIAEVMGGERKADVQNDD